MLMHAYVKKVKFANMYFIRVTGNTAILELTTMLAGFFEMCTKQYCPFKCCSAFGNWGASMDLH